MVKPMKRAMLGLLILLASVLGIMSVTPVLADGTTSITVTKYANDGTTVINQKTVDSKTLESTLPVQGDGTTHQYLQGPTFDTNNLWDPSETVNVKDWGANKGTDLKDLCELVGGMSPGDTVDVKAVDNFKKTFDYPNVYTPHPEQGKMVLCWWYNGQYVPAWGDGIRLVFFAQTTNSAGQYVFGNWDEHEYLPSNRWHYYVSDGTQYPTTTGLSVKNVNQINIHSNQAAGYSLTMSVGGSGTITPAAGSHSCTQGAVVDITATPASGWQFSEWTGTGIADPSSASTTVTIDAAKTVTANFTQQAAANNYDLTMSVSGSGTIAPSSGSHSYAQGAVVDITATPASGWQFSGWTGTGIADPKSAATTVTVDAARTVTAKFTQQAAATNYKLTMATNGSGTITPSSGNHSYAQDTVVKITATAASGWQFAGWTGSGIADPSSASTTVTMDAAKTVTAKFIQKAQIKTAPPVNSANTPKPEKPPQPIQWYIILAIAVVIAAIVIILVALLRRRG